MLNETIILTNPGDAPGLTSKTLQIRMSGTVDNEANVINGLKLEMLDSYGDPVGSILVRLDDDTIYTKLISVNQDTETEHIDVASRLVNFGNSARSFRWGT